MKILFVLEYYYPHIGGVETLFKSLIDNLLKKGYQIIVLTMQFDPSLPLLEDFGELQIIRVPTRSRYFFTLLAIKKVFTLSPKVDLIQTTSYNAAIPAILGSIFYQKKVVITFHEVWGKLWFKLPFISKPSSFLHFLFEQFLLKLPFHHFIAVSKFTENKLLQHGGSPKKISLIYNGIDYDLHIPLVRKESEHKQYLYIGRPGISKGLDILIEAFIPFLEHNSDCSLTLVIPKNNDPVVQWIIKKVAQSAVTDRILITGHLPQEQLTEILENVFAVIIPSYSEGFCYVAAETVAHKIPIIASQNGALPEVVSDYHIFMDDFSSEGLLHVLEKSKDGKWSHTPTLKFELSQTIENYSKLYVRLTKS